MSSNEKDTLQKLIIASGLSAKFTQDALSDEEKQALESWLNENPLHRQWWNQLHDKNYLPEQMDKYHQLNHHTEQALQQFHNSHQKPTPLIGRLWVRWAAAALVLLSFGLFYFLQPEKKSTQPTISSLNDIQPGGSGAVLTLANGQKMILDSLGNGTIIREEDTDITLIDGRLVYEEATGNSTTEVQYNTMSTPNGRQFQLVLPDGTRVWLNAASSIHYPTAFKAGERRVEITGEVYFEVTHNRNQPFIVSSSGMEVEVLGTHFNMNTYNNEPFARTTLLEGSVRVRSFLSSGSSFTLKPGQQAYTANAPGAKLTLANDADIEETIAWKEGWFSFTDASLSTVIRELNRWYNVEISVAANVPAKIYNGKIGRSLTLAQVLEGLAETRLNYSISDDGKSIKILP